MLLLAALAIFSTSAHSQDWQLIEFPSYDHLTDIEMITADSGVVVTASGYCLMWGGNLRSQDGAAALLDQSARVDDPLRANW